MVRTPTDNIFSGPTTNRRKPLAMSMMGTNPTFAPNTTPNSYSALNSTLPSNYTFPDLARYEQTQQNQLGERFQNQIGELKTGIGTQYDDYLKQLQDSNAARRSTLSTSLFDQGKKTFDLQNPSILEDLNSRGVFSSPTAVASAQANALKEIALANQSKLDQYDTNTKAEEDALNAQKLSELTGLDTSGLSARLEAEQTGADQAGSLFQSNLEAQRADAQSAQEQALAKSLADKQSRTSLTNSLIGVGGTLGSTLLAGSLLNKYRAPINPLNVVNPISNATPGVLGGTNPGILSGLPNTGTATASSRLFPGGVGPVGTGGVPAETSTTAGAEGFGGFTPGYGTVAGAGVGAALLSRAAQNKLKDATGSNTIGSVGGAVTNPIGAQLNVAKRLITSPKSGINNISKSLGIGKGSTADGNAIADLSRSVQSTQQQLLDLKGAVGRGEITQDDYFAQAQPIIEQTAQAVGEMAGRGNKYASPINKVWQDFQNAGLVKAQNGQWVAV